MKGYAIRLVNAIAGIGIGILAFILMVYVVVAGTDRYDLVIVLFLGGLFAITIGIGYWRKYKQPRPNSAA